MKVLIVDDSKDMRLLLREIAQRMGHMVIEAENGKEALTLISEEWPEILITDRNMPEMNGLELLMYIAENYPDIKKKMMISGIKGTEAYIEQYRNTLKKFGADFMPKPFDPEVLMNWLSS